MTIIYNTDEIAKIETHEDLQQFIQQLRDSLLKSPQDWENTDLPAFLEALAAWVADADGYYANLHQPLPTHPTWQTIALMLAAAKSYE